MRQLVAGLCMGILLYVIIAGNFKLKTQLQLSKIVTNQWPSYDLRQKLSIDIIMVLIDISSTLGCAG